MKVSKSVVRTSVLALGGLLAAVSPALATTVAYSTAGIFSTTGTNVLTGSGTSSLTFTGNSSGDTINPPSSTTDLLGTFSVNVGTGSITGSGKFTLTLTQTLPNSGTGTAVTTDISGTLARDPLGNGNIDLTFSTPTSFTVGGITYSLNDLQSGDVLVLGATSTQLEATISGSPVPEPSFYALTGVGFVGLLGMAVRRKQQAAA